MKKAAKPSKRTRGPRRIQDPILPDPAQRRARELVLMQLERNLGILQFFCTTRSNFDDATLSNRFVAMFVVHRGSGFGSLQLGYWPPHGLLQKIQDDVIVLAQHGGRGGHSFPPWKAFEQVDRRLRKLRLKSHVGDLIRRARAMLPGESDLNKLVRLAKAGDMKARNSLADMGMNKPEKLDELLQDDQQAQTTRCMAESLVQWIHAIGHPMAKEFVCIEDIRVSYLRSLQRDRTRRFLQRKKTLQKNVTAA